MNKFHVVFISTPGSNRNLVPTVEFARHLTNQPLTLESIYAGIPMI
ncbi:UDP-glucose flavonoid 3-O-glucosyltransferase 6-like protein [Corchorus olitorius]|uniref:UDP-glucose flavonoid 3-O-glucosyltransferase 6-like protein n=1 Tax=Corchorus olitorius TaxID=93759 RepID=A0A1R3KMZ9_9ROSI|nr:UDP-glucose flavonoid 3-O-glucosyltransferase 6-like protein [Corchorus olitorius]